MKDLQKGFVVPFLLVIIALLLLGGGGYMYTQNKHETKPEIVAPTTQSTTTVIGNDVAQCPTYDSKPVITSITPSSGPVGTTIEIKGCNFLGFEGDKMLWFKNSEGISGVMHGEADATTRASNTVMRVTLPRTLCQNDTSYSGLACPTSIELLPGTYTVYSNSYGGNSNAVNFTVTN